MNQISIHDNFLNGYAVDCVGRVIVLHTEFRDRKLHEHTDIVFSGVEAFHFVGDNMRTILFGLAEVSTEQIIEEFAREFEDGVRYCWPGPWNTSMETCRHHFQEQSVKGWIISSSFGGGGFVIAKSMQINDAGAQQPPA